MRILLYSDAAHVIDTLKLCRDSDMALEVNKVSDNRIKTMYLTSVNDIYVIDYDYLDKLGKSYLKLLKTLQVEVIAIVSDLSQLKYFMGFNVIEYYCGHIHLSKVSTCIKRIYKKHHFLNKIQDYKESNRLIVKNKSEAYVLEIDKINYLAEEKKLLHIYTDDRIYVSDDDLDRVLTVLPDKFFKISKSVVANFSKIKEITKVSNKKYKVWFDNNLHYAYITDYMFKEFSDDPQVKSRERYIVDTILECVN